MFKEKLAKFLHYLAFKCSACVPEEAINKVLDDMNDLFTRDDLCDYFSISKSKFNKLIIEGLLSKGRHVKNSEDLYKWSRLEVSNAINKYNEIHQIK